MIRLKHLLLPVLWALSICAQPPPIPLSPTQFSVLTLGDANGEVNVDLWVDLACTDTADAWPTFKKVMEAYKGKSVAFRYHLFPLPYHQHAFSLAKAAVVVASAAGAGATLAFFDTAFTKQSQILNAATASKTYTDVVAMIQEWATEGTGLSLDQIQKGWADDDLEMDTRYSFKYSAIRGVYGTPSIFINHVMVPSIGSDSTLSDWAKQLDPLLRHQHPPQDAILEPLNGLLNGKQHSGASIAAREGHKHKHSPAPFAAALVPCMLVLGLIVAVLRAWARAQRERRFATQLATQNKTAHWSDSYAAQACEAPEERPVIVVQAQRGTVPGQMGVMESERNALLAHVRQ